MSDWDGEAYSRSWASVAYQKDLRLVDLERKKRQNPSYQIEYDITLPEFWFAQQLHGRDFTNTRAGVLAALDELEKNAEDYAKQAVRDGDLGRQETFLRVWKGGIARERARLAKEE